MPRKPKADVAAEQTLTLRLTSADRTLLNLLVLRRREELGADDAEVTAASYVRALIRREGKAKGITVPTPGAPDDPAAAASSTATGGAAKQTTAAGSDAVRLQGALKRAIAGGLSLREIARRAHVDPSSLSRFIKRGSGIAPERLRDVTKVVS